MTTSRPSASPTSLRRAGRGAQADAGQAIAASANDAETDGAAWTLAAAPGTSVARVAGPTVSTPPRSMRTPSLGATAASASVTQPSLSAAAGNSTARSAAGEPAASGATKARSAPPTTAPSAARDGGTP